MTDMWENDMIQTVIRNFLQRRNEIFCKIMHNGENETDYL